MKKWVEGALTVYKKIPMSLVFFLILSDALVIFAPDRFAMLLAVDGFRDEYRKYLGPFFLFAVAALLSKCVPWLQRVVKQRRLKKKRIDLLRNLLPDEKGYLVQYVRKKNQLYMLS